MIKFPRPAMLFAAAILIIVACTAPRVRPPLFPDIVPGEAPRPDSVDAILLLVGDAGEAEPGESPLLMRMKQEIEVWSGLLGRDSAVTVLFLGDNVYPAGVRDRTDKGFAQDSARLWGQINLLDGPKARSRGAIGFFIAGNHDWGNQSGEGGLKRLKNMEAQIQLARKKGIPVQLAPPAGTAGPEVRDIRENMRLLMIDTHFYLQESTLQGRDAFVAGIERAIEAAGDRHVLIAAHHPYTTAGPHGDLVAPLSRALGLMYLLEKSGTFVQDLNSPIYRDLLRRLKQVFARSGPPLAFIGGHDHSLQVHVGKEFSDPQYILVSGAGSKANALVGADSLRYGTARPGFMSMVFHKKGAVDVFVIAGRNTDTAEECPPQQDSTCLRKESEAFGVVYSERLAFRNPPATDTIPADAVVARRRSP